MSLLQNKLIVFSAGTFKNGTGGHYRSLVTIAQAAEKKGNKVILLSFGVNVNQVFKDSKFRTYYVDISQNNLDVTKQIRKLPFWKEYFIFHCFDQFSFYYLSKFTKKILLTKCGGPNPKRFYPYSKYITVFSKENHNWFKANLRYKNSEIKLIPNRIGKVEVSIEKITELRRVLGLKEGDKVVLKISRIVNEYAKHLIEFIQLKSRLTSNVKLIIIGVVHDFETFKKISKLAESYDGVFILTDDNYTKNAKEFLGICDAYVGSGRSLMEACYLRIPVLSHAINSEVPILISKENNEIFRNTNFSGRAFIYSNSYGLQEILDSRKLYDLYSGFSKELYENYFSIETGLNKYFELYEKVNRNNNNKVPFYERLFFKYHVRNILKYQFDINKSIISKF